MIFVHPSIIEVDAVDTKLESILEVEMIPVHAVYASSIPLDMKCVNTVPTGNDAVYEIQNADGTVRTLGQLEAGIAASMASMTHVGIDDAGAVNDARLSDLASVSLINASLTKLIAATTDVSFELRREILKTLSSYVTNHATTALTDTFRSTADVQLRAPQHIAAELKSFEQSTTAIASSQASSSFRRRSARNGSVSLLASPTAPIPSFFRRWPRANPTTLQCS